MLILLLNNYLHQRLKCFVSFTFQVKRTSETNFCEKEEETKKIDFTFNKSASCSTSFIHHLHVNRIVISSSTAVTIYVVVVVVILYKFLT